MDLFYRLWLVNSWSHIGYFGVVIFQVWNYDEYFLLALQFYGLYSTYVCTSAVIRHQEREHIYALLIIVLALEVQYFT